MSNHKLPNTDSIRNLAEFWDAHDITDFDDQLEEVREPVFARTETATITIELDTQDLLTLQRLAQVRGVAQAALVREWVEKNLRAA